VPAPLSGEGSQVLELAQGRIAVNAQFQTSLDGVWAGGDCVGGKLDLTVQAVEDGKRAAQSIDRVLRLGGVRAA
jgi:glutamate synthase (NADPH/NADH) small chain